MSEAAVKKATTYAEFNILRRRLQQLVERVTAISNQVGISEEYQSKLERLKHLVTEEMFRVIVIGGFSRGKSTLINALIGKPILPAKLTPTTAVITVIKYGEEPRAVVRYRNTGETLEVPVDSLRDYLMIPRKAQSQNGVPQWIDTPAEMVEIYYPLEMCKNGVEIVDSPGLEEDETRQKITMRFLNECDAAIVVLSCQQLLTIQEERFIREELVARGFDHIFYALNYADSVTSEDEEDLSARFREKIGNVPRCFFVSARNALHAKLDGDELALQRSGFPVLESSLEQFLVSEPGVTKLRSSQKLLNTYLDELDELLGIKLSMLENARLEDFQRLEREFSERKASILEKKEYVLERIGEKGAHVGERLYSSFSRRCRSIARELPGVARELELDGSIFAQADYKRTVANLLEDWIRSEIRDWVATEAQEILEVEGARLQQLVTSQVEAILDEVQQLKLLIAPEFRAEIQHTENAFERILAAGGSLLLGDLGGVITGGAFGIKGAILQLGGVAAANTALWALGLLNPVTALVASAAVTYGVWKALTPEALTRMRVEVAEQLLERVHELPENHERQIKASVMKEMNRLAEAVNDGVRAMVSNLEHQISSTRAELEANKYAAVQKYTGFRNELETIGSGLSAIVHQEAEEIAAAEDHRG